MPVPSNWHPTNIRSILKSIKLSPVFRGAASERGQISKGGEGALDPHRYSSISACVRNKIPIIYSVIFLRSYILIFQEITKEEKIFIRSWKFGQRSSIFLSALWIIFENPSGSRSYTQTCQKHETGNDSQKE